MPDYAGLYDDYWGRADRWGQHSFQDAQALAERVLSTCGTGSLLDVGCGMGALVRVFLAAGIDATGIDVSARAVEYTNSLAPGRFCQGSVLRLPFDDSAFETVVSTDVLEHLAEEDIPKAVHELHRVARRFAFLTVATAPDRDRRWHLTVRERAWWERRFFEAGFRRHPRLQSVINYEMLEYEPPQIMLIFEKMPAAAVAAFPLETLQRERTLHTDMLRESGRRSDAHIARYALALPYVRPGDVVLDLACGMGYGTAILTAGSAAARVIGVDNSESAIAYANACFAPDYSDVEFHCADAAELAFLPDQSVDLAVVMETLEHLRQPRDFLREIHRVLRPAGRIIVSVPNEWTDETGRDPNPHHQHVYTWPRLREELSERFRLEKAYGQIAGGALKLANGQRKLFEAPPAELQERDAEWWVAVGMKDPVATAAAGYRETTGSDYADIENCHITAFNRDYDNPWLVRGMVSIGLRATSAGLLHDLAQDVLNAARPGSADAGAAICVLAYRLLESDSTTHDEVAHLAERIEAYHAEADDTAHAWRWRISNQYVIARLLLKVGRRDASRAAFAACAELNPVRFSPLLATKTIDACFHVGMLDLLDGKLDATRESWQRGLREARRVLQGDWANVWGDIARPATFGLPEVAQLADLAARCAYGLGVLDLWKERPGYAWSRTHANLSRELTLYQRDSRDLRRWIDVLQEEAAGTTEEWSADHEDSREWLKDKRRDYLRQIRERDATIAELRRWAENLEEAKSWLDEQRCRFASKVADQEHVIAELQRNSQDLAKGKDWLEEQWKLHRSAAADQRNAIEELRAWVAELEKANSGHDAERRKLAGMVDELQAVIERQRSQISELGAALERDRDAMADARDSQQRWKQQRLFRILRRTRLLKDLPPS